MNRSMKLKANPLVFLSILLAIVGMFVLLRGRDSDGPGLESRTARLTGDSSDASDSSDSTSRPDALPAKTGKRSVLARDTPKISKDDIDHWLELPKEEWMAQVDSRTDGMPEVARAEIKALMREFQEARSRRGFTAEHPDYRSRRDAILDCYSQAERTLATGSSAADSPDAEAPE